MVDMYTDGSCLGNPGPGGWGVAVFEQGTLVSQHAGGHRATTNNLMELTAAIEAMGLVLALNRSARIRADSQYVIRGINEWLPSWKKRGWRTSDNKPIANLEAWKVVDAMLSQVRHLVRFEWVRGHNGNYGNELADSLANEAAGRASCADTKTIRIDGANAATESPGPVVAAPSAAFDFAACADFWQSMLDEGDASSRRQEADAWIERLRRQAPAATRSARP